MEINKVFISLGSNLGDRTNNLLSAKNRIKILIGKLIKESKIYETEAWGVKNQKSYLNQVLKIETFLKPHEILSKCLTIEKILGRIRNKKWSSRTIDLDILYYNNEIIDTENLIIPHPEIENRMFILIPLEEIEKDYLHPKLNKTNLVLLKLSKDSSKVSEYGMGFE